MAHMNIHHNQIYSSVSGVFTVIRSSAINSVSAGLMESGGHPSNSNSLNASKEF